MSKKEISTLKDACKQYGVEYREGVTRLIDLAKKLEVSFEDGETVNNLITKYENR